MIIYPYFRAEAGALRKKKSPGLFWKSPAPFSKSRSLLKLIIFGLKSANSIPFLFPPRCYNKIISNYSIQAESLC